MQDIVLQTYKIKHNIDVSEELIKAKRVITWIIKNRFKGMTSKHVKHFGLKAAITENYTRKYNVKNLKCRRVNSVKLIISGHRLVVNKEKQEIWCSTLKLRLPYQFDNSFLKLHQIELDNTYCYVTVSYPAPDLLKPTANLGVDLNTSGHCAVAALSNGKVMKLGKKAFHIRMKYRNLRKKLQKKNLLKVVKKINHKESMIMRDLNHKISRKIVDVAKANNCIIKMENLKGARSRMKSTNKRIKYALNSWTYAQLRFFIEYKSKKLGVPVAFVNPAYTSKICSRCGKLGKRNKKKFKCRCGYIEHADVNAAFNIAASMNFN